MSKEKRRRWPWIVLAIALLLCPVVWRLRPLKANELRLVGPWNHGPDYDQYRLMPNRRFTMQRYGSYGLEDGTVTGSGSWYCEGDRLVMLHDETLTDLAYRLLGRSRFLHKFSGRLTWTSNDQFLMDDVPYGPPELTWRRKDQATETNAK